MYILYRMILSHPVFGYIKDKASSMRGSSLPSPKILHGPIRSTYNLSHVVASAFLVVIFPYFKCFFSQVLQTLLWVRMSSLKLGHY